jgi:tetratricopeptide (TPR) repeat protein
MIRRGVLLLTGLGFLLLGTGCVSSSRGNELAAAYYDLGNAYMELERWEDARAAYEQALQADPAMRRAAYNLSRALVRAGELIVAERRLQALLRDDPDNGILLETLAWVYVQQGETGLAAETYRRALNYRPHDVPLLFNVALLAGQRGNWSSAYDHLLTIVELEEADGQVYYQLGESAAKLEDKEAAGWYARAVEKEPGSLEYREALARAYAKQEDYEQAASEYAELAERNPERAGEYEYRRAYVLLTGAEDYAAGMAALERALEEGFGELSALAELVTYPDLLDPEPVWTLLEDYDLAEQVRSEIERQEEAQNDNGVPLVPQESGENETGEPLAGASLPESPAADADSESGD